MKGHIKFYGVLCINYCHFFKQSTTAPQIALPNALLQKHLRMFILLCTFGQFLHTV